MTEDFKNKEEKGKAYLSDKYTGQLLDKVSKEELRETVPVPAGIDTNEWLATNSMIKLNCITLYYITLHEITLHYISLHYITLH